jgi:hypothetical protein
LREVERKFLFLATVSEYLLINSKVLLLSVRTTVFRESLLCRKRGEASPKFGNSLRDVIDRIGGIPDETRQIYDNKDFRTLTGKVWTLPDLVNEALMRNPSTRSAWESASASAADLGTAKANYYPTLTLSGSVSGNYSRTPTFPGATTTKTGSLTPQVRRELDGVRFRSDKSGRREGAFYIAGVEFFLQ